METKEKKQFAADLKKICHASNERKCREALQAAAEKWKNCPNAIKSWFKNWDAIVPIFKFSTTVRTVIYTTNAIESLNSTYRKPTGYFINCHIKNALKHDELLPVKRTMK